MFQLINCLKLYLILQAAICLSVTIYATVIVLHNEYKDSKFWSLDGFDAYNF